LSGGTVCKCDPKRLVILAYKVNHSAFNGYRETPSAYSTVRCARCGTTWRTKALYVEKVRRSIQFRAKHGIDMPPGVEIK
jgi:hypothetical protein